MYGVSSGQISQCVMKIHIEAEASQPRGWAKRRGTASVGSQASNATEITSRTSRSA